MRHRRKPTTRPDEHCTRGEAIRIRGVDQDYNAAQACEDSYRAAAADDQLTEVAKDGGFRLRAQPQQISRQERLLSQQLNEGREVRGIRGPDTVRHAEAHQVARRVRCHEWPGKTTYNCPIRDGQNAVYRR